MRACIASVLASGLVSVPAVARENVASLTQPVIYDQDDRKDVFAVEDELLRERARHSAVAFLEPHRLLYSGASVSIEAPIQSDVYDLCEGEAFAEQPAASRCSGVLIDDDLVLTAGHCVGLMPSDPEQTCANTAFVFGYLLDDPGRLANITEDDVYRCRRIVTWQFDEVELAAPDYGIIQLDRPTVGQQPVPISSTPVRVGDPVHLIGFGARLPAKVDSGGVVDDTSNYDEYFGATTDTFEGASGSPVLNVDGELVAVHTRGNEDWTVNDQCISAAHRTSGSDEHQIVSTPITALCDAGWPSERLCGTVPECGDDVCSSGETPSNCAQDCERPQCGNARCEDGERETCSLDCNPFAEVPTAWFCPPEYWEDQAGCDCGCGPRDPDCDDASEVVLGCEEGETCGSDGRCTGPRGGNRPRTGCGLSVAPAVESPSSWVGWLLLAALLGARRRRRQPSLRG